MKLTVCDICQRKTTTVKLAFGPRACWICIGDGVKNAEKKAEKKKKPKIK